eukprot:3615470-Alexandrium_andersonii.AAC.1
MPHAKFVFSGIGEFGRAPRSSGKLREAPESLDLVHVLLLTMLEGRWAWEVIWPLPVLRLHRREHAG